MLSLTWRPEWQFKKVVEPPQPAVCGVRNDKVKVPALSVDPTSGETHLRHRVTPDGFYRGNQVIAQPEIEDDDE